MKVYFRYLLILVALVIIVINTSFKAQTSHLSQKADYILVEKSKRTLTLYYRNNLIKTYKIALGSSPVGDKEVEGDMKTPEGKYYIISKNPHSSYHLSLKISYPSKQKIDFTKSKGLNLGGDIRHY